MPIPFLPESREESELELEAADSGAGAPVGAIPDRYQRKEDEEGAYLTCLEAPEVKVRVRRDLSVPAAAARKYAEGSIFLDGAAQAEPFLDLERRVYNLDHHQGCVRRFTLSACEQALVLVLRGLDLRERPWTIYANELDLDTMLAIWVLLNSVHLKEANEEVRRAITPLVRLEGTIDAHGLEMREFTGFSEERLEVIFARLETLREDELASKADGSWGQMDLAEFALAQLQKVDRLVYPIGFFKAFRGVEELARSELTDDKIVVVCRSDGGIYEVEKDLKRLYGRRLGLIVLQKDERTYTLRQVDHFLRVNLEVAYRRLNHLDPAARSGNRWGGSGEIGGSPRASGTDLSPAEIAAACRLAYRRPPLSVRLAMVGLAVLLSFLSVAAARVAAVGPRAALLGAAPWSAGELRFALTGIAVACLGLVLLARKRRRRDFGLGLPKRWDWLIPAPVVVAAALAGGVWIAAPTVGLSDPAALATILLLPLFAELVFRGIALGVLSRGFAVQHSPGRWFLSWPTGISAALYALWTALPWWSPLSSAGLVWPEAPLAVAVAAALVAGLGLGIARERSGSLVAPIGLHYLGIAAVLVAVAIF